MSIKLSFKRRYEELTATLIELTSGYSNPKAFEIYSRLCELLFFACMTNIISPQDFLKMQDEIRDIYE